MAWVTTDARGRVWSAYQSLTRIQRSAELLDQSQAKQATGLLKKNRPVYALRVRTPIASWQ
jgi:hypothetical protein